MKNHRFLTIFISFISFILYSIPILAASPIMSITNDTVTVENAPTDSTLFTVLCKNGNIVDVLLTKGEGRISSIISNPKDTYDVIKAFLWNSNTLTPLTNATSSEEQTTSAKKTLVACFSQTGNTKPLAEYARDYLNADFYEIVPEVPYTSADINYNNSNSRANKEQNDSTARPKINGSVANMDQYDTIIIAHPIWWGQAPRIIYTFLESYDFSGKTITTMCTSASSPLGSSATNLKPLTPSSTTWLGSKRFSIGASKTDVITWLNSIGLMPNQNEKQLIMKVNNIKIPVTWETNPSVDALIAQAKQGDINISMSMYGGWEQVGPLGKQYPTNDSQLNAKCGDIMLYSSNQIVLFYGGNSWSYTRLGKINLPDNEIVNLLNNKNITLTISFE